MLTLWTADHANQLEPALIRLGRIDKSFEFKMTMSNEDITKTADTRFESSGTDLNIHHHNYPCVPAQLHSFPDSCTAFPDTADSPSPWLGSMKLNEDEAMGVVGTTKVWQPASHGSVSTLGSPVITSEKLQKDAIHLAEEESRLEKVLLYTFTAVSFRQLGINSYQMSDDMAIIRENASKIISALPPDITIVELGVA